MLVAIGAAVSSLHIEVPETHVTEACRTLLARGDLLAAGLLALAGLGALSLARAAATAVRISLASRRASRSQRVVGKLPTVSGVAFVIDAPQPDAFCAGLLRPRVYITNAAVALLGRSELAAVLAHEAHHARARDPLRLMAARAVAAGLFFLPALQRALERYAASAELAADAAAARRGAGVGALASALLTFEGHTQGRGIAPERVDHLTGHAVRWQLAPRRLLSDSLTALVLLGLSLAAAVSASRADAAVAAVTWHSGVLVTVGAAMVAALPLAKTLCRRRLR